MSTKSSPLPTTRAGTMADAVRLWLVAHPGPHRPVDIAGGMAAEGNPIPTHRAAMTCMHLTNRGILKRYIAKSGNRNHSLYEAMVHPG